MNQINEIFGSGYVENLADELRSKSEKLSDECLDNSFVVTEGQPRNIVHVKESDCNTKQFLYHYYTIIKQF